MSKSSKIWILVIIIVVIILGWLYFNKPNKGHLSSSSSVSTSTGQTNSTTSTDIVSNIPIDILSATDTSDISIDQDLKSIDSQINNLNKDSVNIDQNLK